MHYQGKGLGLDQKGVCVCLCVCVCVCVASPRVVIVAIIWHRQALRRVARTLPFNLLSWMNTAFDVPYLTVELGLYNQDALR